MAVIELMILGFLTEGPMHGYELRRRMSQLHGFARTISDGTMYPAINRLIAAGAITQDLQPGSGAAQRRVLELTDAGRATLQARLRDAGGHDITDGGRFFVILAFLSLLPDRRERDAVLQRRLEFLTAPVSFFADGERSLTADEVGDRYRRGIFVSARASNTAERAWLREELAASAACETSEKVRP